MNGEHTKPVESRTEDQRPVHETAEVEFYVIGGVVEARTKAGLNLPDGVVTNLLLLDIAQSLMDIRLWGIAQNRDGGQVTQVTS